MTVDEFIADLDRFGQQATNLSDILTNIGSEVTQDIKRNLVTTSGTGALKASIQFSVTEDTLTLGMLNYGIFQNYGVDGTKEQRAIPVESGIFGVPAGYKFRFKSQTIGGSLPFPVKRSIAERGLKPKQFFSVKDLTDEVTLRIQEELTRQFN